MNSKEVVSNKPSYNIMDDDIENDILLEDVYEVIEYSNDISDQLHSISGKSQFSSNLETKLINLYNEADTSLSMMDTYEHINMYLSNSPITMSGNSSETENEDNASTQTGIKTKKHKYPKLTYDEVEQSVQKYYEQDKYSSELDILITFVKGQKHIYLQSTRITQQKINMLVFPCLLITSTITIMSPLIYDYYWSSWLVSVLNVFLTIFISLTNFLGLQTHLFKYNNFEFHFNRLLSSLITTRNQIYLMHNTNNKSIYIVEKIKEAEQRMLEMRESNNISIPVEVESLVPIISHIDIFLFIRNIEQNRKNRIIQYKDIKNEIRYIIHKWSQQTNILNEPNNSELSPMYIQREKEKQRLNHLLLQKESIKKELMDNKNAYTHIDEIFAKEIQYSETKFSSFWYLFNYYFFCGFNRPPNMIIDHKLQNIKHPNSDISFDKYLEFIFSK